MTSLSSNCDPQDRRKPATYLATARCLLLVLCAYFANCSWVVGQASFAPPPRPTSTSGAYNPTLPPPIAPPVVQQPVASAPSVAPETNPITPTNAQPIEGGEIVARVNGQIVLASDVLWQVNKIIEANRDRIPPEQVEKARRELLRQQVMGLVDTKLLYADFRQNIPPENLPKIEENLLQPFEENEVPRLIELLELKDNMELVEKLESFGSSLDDVRRQFNERTIAGEWLRQKAPKPKPVTHDQMLEYYQEHLAEYDFPAQAKWEELMVRFNRLDGDRAAAWRAIADLGNEIWQRASKHPGLRGPIFSELAKQKSHGFSADKGGLQDWTTKGALRSEALNEALFSLQVGQLSNIIETEAGFHIIRVLQRKDAGRTPFTEAQAAIRKQLESGGQQKLVQEELKKLRKNCCVWTAFDGDLSGPRLSEIMQKRQRR
ncbi:MAG: hypothetical protein GXP26_06420 [Planctomycetes bacterium]|nr:hypothetical protein [Planctomycetota bacterium]